LTSQFYDAIRDAGKPRLKKVVALKVDPQALRLFDTFNADGVRDILRRVREQENRQRQRQHLKTPNRQPARTSGLPREQHMSAV
jgi:hypothetical protein